MYRILNRNMVTICGAVVVPETSKTLSSEDTAVKWQRVKQVFYIDEFGEITPQLQTMIQTTLFTGFFGCFYGGFISSRDAYFKFIDRNEATKFVDHFEAKKKLQQTVTLGFAKGAMKWGWRLALFGGFYISFVTVFAAYKGSSGILDYTLAGLLSGAIYRVHMGLRAMIAAGTLGAMMGMFAGGLSSLLLRLTGSTLDDIQQYTTQMTAIRNRHLEEAVKKKQTEDPENLILMHESIIEQEKTP